VPDNDVLEFGQFWRRANIRRRLPVSCVRVHRCHTTSTYLVAAVPSTRRIVSNRQRGSLDVTHVHPTDGQIRSSSFKFRWPIRSPVSRPYEILHKRNPPYSTRALYTRVYCHSVSEHETIPLPNSKNQRRNPFYIVIRLNRLCDIHVHYITLTLKHEACSSKIQDSTATALASSQNAPLFVIHTTYFCLFLTFYYYYYYWTITEIKYR